MAFGGQSRKKHSKPGKTTLRAFQFLLDINAEQAKKLRATLDLAFDLRNLQAQTLKQNRIDAREARQLGLKPNYMSAQGLQDLVAKKHLEPCFLALHSQVRQDISHRISEGQKRWLEAIKAGNNKVKPPDALMRKKFRSICYPQYGTSAHIQQGKLHLSRLGEFRVIGWRKMRGAKKSITLKFKDGRWWAIVMCACQERDVCRPYASVKDLPEMGLDPGLSAVLNDSYGKSYAAPKPLKKAALKLQHLQKDVSRKFEVRKAQHLKALSEARQSGSRAPVADGLIDSLRAIPYSNRLRASIKKLAKAHTKVERIRLDAARKTARKVEKTASRVAVEEHGLGFMMANRRLAKATADVAIGQQKQILQSALGSGRYFKVGNRRPEGGNSQTCLCGASVPKELSDRHHNCPECGLQGPRDQVSAIIVQHSAFGSVPDIQNNSQPSTPGLGVLEQAAKLLETRRGEVKARAGESRTCELAAKRALETSVKRPARTQRVIRKTRGADSFASLEVKTARHVNSVDSCLAETKSAVNQNMLKRPRGSDSGFKARSTILHVGE